MMRFNSLWRLVQGQTEISLNNKEEDPYDHSSESVSSAYGSPYSEVHSGETCRDDCSGESGDEGHDSISDGR